MALPLRWRVALRAMARRAAAARVRQPPKRALRAWRRRSPAGPFSPRLQRSQEVEDVLPLSGREGVEPRDDGVRLGAGARMLLDRPEDTAVGRSGAAVVEEEDPLAGAPQGSAAELVRPGVALRHAVGESAAHVVDREVAE